MTHRQRATAALARAADPTLPLAEVPALVQELRDLHRKLRGGHNSVGRRASIVALRGALLNGAYDLRQRLLAPRPPSSPVVELHLRCLYPSSR